MNKKSKADGRVNNGGAREGAGRPTIDHPKKPLGAKVDKVTRDKVLELSRETGKSQAFVVEKAVEKINIKDLK